jgi:hypothetical protein
MNRHQRRAAKANQGDATGPQQPNSSQGLSAPDIKIDLDPNLMATTDQGLAVNTSKLEFAFLNDQKVNAAPDKPKAGLLLRLFSRLLLSRFVLNRVSQPEVQRLLMSVAIEVDRKDVVDELQRRDQMRIFR